MAEDKARGLAEWVRHGMAPEEGGPTLDDVAAELERLAALTETLQATVNEADRRAGSAERLLEQERSTGEARQRWLREAKAAAGYPDRVSFDVVWAEALAAMQSKRADDVVEAALVARRERGAEGNRLETPVTDGGVDRMERNHTPMWPKVVEAETARELEREVRAWRARFPGHVYLPAYGAVGREQG